LAYASSKEVTVLMAESTLASPKSEAIADLKAAKMTKSKKKQGRKRRSQDFDQLAQAAEAQNVSGKHKSATRSLISGKRLYCRVLPMLTPTRSEVDGITDVVMINDDYHPIIINNEHFTGHAVFRVKNFRGVTPIDSKDGSVPEPISGTEYFTGHRRTFSLQIAGRFRKPWSADEVMFGTFFQKPVLLPPFYSIAIAVAKKIDASMDGDLASARPYMCSPAICAMNTARADPIIPPKLARIPEQPGEPLYLPPWRFGGAKKLEENFMATVSNWPEARLYRSTSTPGALEHDDLSDSLSSEADEELETNASSGKATRKSSFSGFFSRSKNDSESGKQLSTPTPHQRRSWFLKPENRLAYTYQPDTLYSFDFNNQYVDLNTMTLKLGISFDARHYLNDQPVVYQMRSRDGSVIFFTIELGLV
jgi:hypothetical protein